LFYLLPSKPTIYTIAKTGPTSNLIKHVKSAHCEAYFDTWVLPTLVPAPEDAAEACKLWLASLEAPLAQPTLCDVIMKVRTLYFELCDTSNYALKLAYSPGWQHSYLVKWLVCDSLPFCTAESKHFEEYVKSLNPAVQSVSRATVGWNIAESFEAVQAQVKDYIKVSKIDSVGRFYF